MPNVSCNLFSSVVLPEPAIRRDRFAYPSFASQCLCDAGVTVEPFAARQHAFFWLFVALVLLREGRR